MWCRSLPRIGLHFGVGKRCEQVDWYGAGPHECYWDRKSGAPVREYSSTVQDMHVPYIVPGGRLGFYMHCDAYCHMLGTGPSRRTSVISAAVLIGQPSWGYMQWHQHCNASMGGL